MPNKKADKNLCRETGEIYTRMNTWRVRSRSRCEFSVRLVFRQQPSSLSSFVTKWGSRISRERLDLESQKVYPNLHTGRSTITPDMTSLSTSGWQLSKFRKRSKMPHPTDSQSYISITAWARITRFSISLYRPALHLHRMWRHANWGWLHLMWLIHRVVKLWCHGCHEQCDSLHEIPKSATADRVPYVEYVDRPDQYQADRRFHIRGTHANQPFSQRNTLLV